MRGYFILALCAAAADASAQTVYRCTGPDGKVVFSQQGCGTAPSEDQLYDARNVAPSGGKEVIPYGAPSQFDRPRTQNERPRYNVVGANGHCPSPVSVEEAMRDGYPSRGMSAEQVRRMYGPPDNVSASTNGYLNHVWYSTETRPYRSVTYGADRCVSDVFVSQSRAPEPERRQPGTRANTVRRN